MSDSKPAGKKPDARHEPSTYKPLHGDKQPWTTPKMEDVSEEVMAQPYIRFT